MFTLPDKYSFNAEESLSGNMYIDDNALFAYFCIFQGLFDPNSDPEWSFIFSTPFEWKSTDFISFLLSVSRSRGFKIESIKTVFLALEDDYEISDDPRVYGGAYKWILDLCDTEPERDEVDLFTRFFDDIASADDLERALIYSDRIAPAYKNETSEAYLSKDIFRNILDHTSFAVILTPIQRAKLQDDIISYLEVFEQNKLVRNSNSKSIRRIGDASVSQSQNIFTFKKHSLLFREYLQKMQDDFGSVVTIENTFEDRFPNYKYPDTEFVRKRYAERNFFFVHILLSFEKQGFIKILRLSNNWSIHEDRMLAYEAEIEILPSFRDEELLQKLHFDEDRSRFYVQGQEIRLRKFKDEYHTLRILFKDPQETSKEWFFSEIAEEVDENNMNEKKYYNAIHQLRLKLQSKGISDFFITTKQSVKINSKYLS